MNCWIIPLIAFIHTHNVYYIHTVHFIAAVDNNNIWKALIHIAVYIHRFLSVLFRKTNIYITPNIN